MVAACGLCGGSFEAALKSGNVSAALAFMDDDPLAVARTPFARGNTLWHIAAKCGSLEMLQALLARLQAVWPDTSIQREQANQADRWANPFQRLSDGLRGMATGGVSVALGGGGGSGASGNGMCSLAQHLNVANVLGQTPLMVAAQRGHTACVRFLMDAGATPWSRDRGYCTALHYAALLDKGPAIEAILSHPSSARPPAGMRQVLMRLVDLGNFCGYTPLHYAAAANKPCALAALMAGGANIACRTWSEGSDWVSGRRGSTALHLAARRGDEDMCKAILRHYAEVLRDSGGVDPRLHTDMRHCRPYQLAEERGNTGLAKMLMPWTPLTAIFTHGEELRTHGVPKLKALAAAALQTALLAQINDAEAAAEVRRQAAAEASVAAALRSRSGPLLLSGGAADHSAAVADGGGATAAAVAVEGGDGGAGALAAPPPMASRQNSLVSSIGSVISIMRKQSLRSVKSLQQRLRGGGALGPDGALAGGGDFRKYSGYGGYGRVPPSGSTARGDLQQRSSLYGDSDNGGEYAASQYTVQGGSGYGGFSMYGNISHAAAEPAPLYGAPGGSLFNTASVPATPGGAAAGWPQQLPQAGSRTSTDEQRPRGQRPHNQTTALQPLGSVPGYPIPRHVNTRPSNGWSPSPRGTSPVPGDSGGSSPRTAAAAAATASTLTAGAPLGHSNYTGGMYGSANGASTTATTRPAMVWPFLDARGAVGYAEDPVVAAPDGGSPPLQAGGGALQQQLATYSAGLDTAEKNLTRGSGPFSAAGARPDAGCLVAPPPIQPHSGPTAPSHVVGASALIARVSPTPPSPSRLHSPLKSSTAAAAATSPLPPIKISPFAMPAVQLSQLSRRSASGSDARPLDTTSAPAGHSPPRPNRGGGATISNAVFGALQPVDELNEDPASHPLTRPPLPPHPRISNGGGGSPRLASASQPLLSSEPGTLHANGTAPEAVSRFSGEWRSLGHSGDAGGSGGGGGRIVQPLQKQPSVAAAAGTTPEPGGGSPRSFVSSIAAALNRFRSGGIGAPPLGTGGAAEPSGGADSALPSGQNAVGAPGSLRGGGGGTLTAAGSLKGAGSLKSARGGGGDGPVGSDTSDDLCGICFERPAVLRLRPCSHMLCADCSREVTRMVEIHPPSCPYCRSTVRGFGC